MRLTGNGDGFQAPANAEERNNKTPSGAANTLGRFTGGHEPMNATMLQPDPHAVKHGRFVPARPNEAEEQERQIGRNLYRRGRDISECVTDYMTAGYLAEEARCEDAYWREMMRDGAVKFVNWNSGAEVW